MSPVRNGLIGTLVRPTFRIEVVRANSPPVQNGTLPDGTYIYLTKIHNRGDIGERSIGLPAGDIEELLSILKKL